MRSILRLFDLVFSVVGIVFLLPFLLVIGLIIKISDKGSVFYIQERVGRHGKVFNIIKLRTMVPESDKNLLLTLRDDQRVTFVGKFLRRYKLDELPQLFNVLIGEMSIVGPRPEVKKYVDFYTTEQMEVLKVKPGITDFASIHYSNENEILTNSSDPETYYLDVIMPEKIKLSMIFVNNPGLKNYFRIIFKTLARLIK